MRSQKNLKGEEKGKHPISPPHDTLGSTCENITYMRHRRQHRRIMALVSSSSMSPHPMNK
ncbi:hypothetical protein Lal_00010003 [Lupinus albus]|nr:hypothetical protein Lal_00010003 [Lupinus albus]